MQPPPPGTAPPDASGPCQEKSLPGLAVSSSCCHRDAQSFSPELSERCWGMELARAAWITSFPGFKTSALGISPWKGKCSTLVERNLFFPAGLIISLPPSLCSSCCSSSHPAKPSSSNKNRPAGVKVRVLPSLLGDFLFLNRLPSGTGSKGWHCKWDPAPARGWQLPAGPCMPQPLNPKPREAPWKAVFYLS